MPRPKRIQTKAEEKYENISSTVKRLRNSDDPNERIKAIAIECAFALSAVYQIEIDELDTKLFEIMPKESAEKMLECIEEYKPVMKFAYVGKEISPEWKKESGTEPEWITNEDFYCRKVSIAPTIHKCIYQLAKSLLHLEEQDVLTTDMNHYIELAGKQKLQRLCFSGRAKMLTDWIKTVWKADVTPIDWNRWNPSPQIDKLLFNTWYGISEQDKAEAENGKIVQWLKEGTKKEFSELSYVGVLIASAVNSLSPDGRAVAVVNSEWLYETEFWEERKFFVSQGCIESVILLPSRVSIVRNYSLLVLCAPDASKKRNVRFCNARSATLLRNESNHQVLSEETVQNILQQLEEGKDAVSCEKLCQGNCNLYYHQGESTQLTEFLQNVSSPIIRGAMIRPSEIEEMQIKDGTETNNYLIQMQNIQNGCLNLTANLSQITQDNRYCIFVEEGATEEKTVLLISRAVSESPDGKRKVFKTALLENSDIKGKKLLLTGNVYALYLDNKKVNPFYIQAYLESKEGQEQITRLTNGRSFLNVEDLRLLTIPKCEEETQKKIADEFKKNLKVIKEGYQASLRSCQIFGKHQTG
ncbi:MAG TPA: hypothetical protein DCO72_07985 [Ruminococcus sp.]|nr:hypothetical protein [Ruminococcus sp.]